MIKIKPQECINNIKRLEFGCVFKVQLKDSTKSVYFAVSDNLWSLWWDKAQKEKIKELGKAKIKHSYLKNNKSLPNDKIRISKDELPPAARGGFKKVLELFKKE